MNALRAAWRLGRVLLHVLSGLFTVMWHFPRLKTAQKEARVSAWAHALLGHLAIELRVHGSPPPMGPVLLVANHVSWLDIVVLHAARHCRFVSKAELRRWPLIGTLATAAGTLYIERASRRDALRVVHHMAERLQAGEVLAVFPEGTTSDGRALLPFHANLFQAAIAADAPVLPVGLRFADAASGLHSQAPCYIDDDTLVGSLWRTLTSAPLRAELRFGEPQQAQGRDRRTLAADLQQAVASLRGPTVGG